MKLIKVDLKGTRSYNIIAGYRILNRLGGYLRKLAIGNYGVVITTPVIKRQWGGELSYALRRGAIDVVFKEVPDTEKSKSANTCLGLLNDIAVYGKAKKIFLMAFGGGVTGDLAGFIASVYKRGVPYVQIPTTLVAQVDSAIGGKTAIDLKVGKNLIGSFYQPRLVFSELRFLETLPSDQIKNGLAEVIKYGVISDSALFGFIENNIDSILRLDKKALGLIVRRSAEIKARVVEEDELDSLGKRIILNYGHTIGHAIETASGYSKLYTHGMAVSIGMIAANFISREMGFISASNSGRVENLLRLAGLPVRAKRVSPAKVYEAHLYDKKFLDNKNRLILAVKIGRVKVVEGVSDELIKKAINYVCKM